MHKRFSILLQIKLIDLKFNIYIYFINEYVCGITFSQITHTYIAVAYILNGLINTGYDVNRTLHEKKMYKKIKHENNNVPKVTIKNSKCE